MFNSNLCFTRAISRPYYDFLCFSFLFTSVLDEAALTRQQCPILSLFLQRCMLDLTRTSEVAEKIKANLQGKVSRMKRKDFMGPITIEDVSLGTNVPFFSNFRFNDEVLFSFLFFFDFPFFFFPSSQQRTEHCFKTPKHLWVHLKSLWCSLSCRVARCPRVQYPGASWFNGHFLCWGF